MPDNEEFKAENIYFTSDDDLFFMGCETILRRNGYAVNRISQDELPFGSIKDKIKEHDMVIFSLNSHPVRKETLEQLACIGVMVIFFVDTPSKNLGKSTLPCMFFSKKMSINQLIPSIEKIKKNVNKKGKTYLFTPREVDIMGRISNGHSCIEISKKLNIKRKTVYSHKNNFTRKTGIPNSIFFRHFSL